jgi:copper chaperone CopZ
MKKIIRFTAVALLTALPLIASSQDKAKTTETVKYKTSIDCEECVKTIMSNLPQEKGIKDVKCDLKTKEVTVTYQRDKNTPDQIKRSLEKLGYSAKLESTTPVPAKK